MKIKIETHSSSPATIKFDPPSLFCTRCKTEYPTALVHVCPMDLVGLQVGKIKISRGIPSGYWLTNDDEGMCFSEAEFENLLKEMLYKYF